MAEEQQDISSRTLFVLVVLVLVVSFIGAWVSMTQVGGLTYQGAATDPGTDTAHVAFTIEESPDHEISATGEVAFAIDR